MESTEGPAPPALRALGLNAKHERTMHAASAFRVLGFRERGDPDLNTLDVHRGEASRGELRSTVAELHSLVQQNLRDHLVQGAVRHDLFVSTKDDQTRGVGVESHGVSLEPANRALLADAFRCVFTVYRIDQNHDVPFKVNDEPPAWGA